jgi:hypothetical protein
MNQLVKLNRLFEIIAQTQTLQNDDQCFLLGHCIRHHILDDSLCYDDLEKIATTVISIAEKIDIVGLFELSDNPLYKSFFVLNVLTDSCMCEGNSLKIIHIILCALTDSASFQQKILEMKKRAH